MMTDKTKFALFWVCLVVGLFFALGSLVCRWAFPWFDNDWKAVCVILGFAIMWLGYQWQPITDQMIEYSMGGWWSVIMMLCLSCGGILELLEIEHFTPGIIAVLVVALALLALDCVLVFRFNQKVKSLQKERENEKKPQS